MNYRTITDISKLIDNNINRFHFENFELIVGIPRSGMIPASIIALKLNLPVISLSDLIENSNVKTGITRKAKGKLVRAQDAKKVLIIDDSYNSGKSLKEIQGDIDKLREKIDIKLAVAYSSIKNNSDIDFYLEYLPQPRCFEWNLFHSSIVNKTLFDIDGVVCYDPSDKDNDDGILYKKFLKNAEPKFIPSMEVKAFVTSRLEKYRKETEDWFEKNNITYQNLIMSKHESAEIRRINGDHAVHKANYYKKSDAILFIESDELQAKKIAKISGKDVICIDTNKLYKAHTTDIIKSANVKGLSYKIKQIIKSNKFIMKLYIKYKI